MADTRMPHVLRFEECTADLVDRVGGKALGLGNLVRFTPDVPPGFVLTTRAYRDWLSGQGLEGELERLVEAADGPASQEAASREIRALFEHAALTEELIAEVGRAYALLGGGAGPSSVAVRSSATSEDVADASFAGQQETYLGVTGLDSVAARIVECWASLFTPHAISYRRRLGVPTSQVAMAVVVQRMVEAEVSGVMLTVDPVTGDPSQIDIEAVRGLGLPLVGGELNPDRYSVDKVTLEIRSRSIVPQPFADRLDPSGWSVRRVEVPEEEGAAPCLRDEEVVRIAGLGKQTERALGGAVDIEWALGPGPGGPRHLYLLQARPETVHSTKRAEPVAPPQTSAMDRMLAMMVPGARKRTDRTLGAE